MEGQIPEDVKTRRSHILIELGKKQERAYMESFLGKEVEVLFEEITEIEGETLLDRTYQRVYKDCG